ncbi:MAG: 8-amino-7-oxononanoate synthase [Verrucomicrobia bacterium]|nr:8-amino-7-oxononanoate synthase [Verrucomicrobiota bacterium]
MLSFDAELRTELAALQKAGLLRELRRVDTPQGSHVTIGGRPLLNFSSNDYLGLANHPALKEAAVRASTDFGAGAGASRLICGSLAPFHELEEVLAAWKGTEAALTFSTGYAAALGTLTALVGKDDILILDKLVHACVVDGARLCGAKLRIFRHNDLEDLEAKLRWAAAQSRHPSTRRTPAAGDRQRASRTLVITESVFSMDGDRAPLAEIVALKERYGAWLMVDEAHATGLHGRRRCGLAEALGISEHIEIQMGTLGKALGSSGGYVCGHRALINNLVNRARSFIYSTAPVPAAAAAATAAVRLVQSNHGATLNAALWERVSELDAAIRTPRSPLGSAIFPIILGDETAALAAAAALREQGLLVPAIRYPTVARGAARLRVTCTAAHSRQDVEQLAAALHRIPRL